MRFVKVDSLAPGMKVARDIIANRNVVMITRGMILSETLIQRLNKNGYMGLYISDQFSEELEMEESIDPKLFNKGVEAVETQNIDEIANIATDIVVDISSKDNVCLDLFDLRSFDDYTFHHSVNVAVYSVIIGRELGLDKNDLNLLCFAAICHDFGKTKVPEEIIKKPAKLTDEEYDEIKKHPRYTFDILGNMHGIPAKIKQAVLCHHENENGSGYPLGKAGDDIPLFSKIIHAADVFDALISRRSYKEAYSPADAFEYLEGGKNILFDEKIVDIMKKIIPAFPPGIDVVLSNGEEAMVLGHTGDTMRPIVKMIEDGRKVNLEKDPEYKKVRITKSGLMPEDYVGEVKELNESRFAEVDERETILVVDDSNLTLTQTRKILEPDYNVVTLPRGAEAVEYMKTHKCPDLVLMDIILPDINGMDCIRIMRGMAGFNCPVIFYTAKQDRETILKCRELDAVDYILKPVLPVYLKERVAVALKKYMIG